MSKAGFKFKTLVKLEYICVILSKGTLIVVSIVILTRLVVVIIYKFSK